MLQVKYGRKANQVKFVKDWDITKMSCNYVPSESKKMSLKHESPNVQGLLLYDLTESCFNRIKARVKSVTQKSS